MEEYIISQHSSHCNGYTKLNGYMCQCNINPERFLFYYNYNFYLICYFNCLAHGDHLSFKESIICELDSKIKSTEENIILRRWAAEDLKEFRIRGKQLKLYINQIHYRYPVIGRGFNTMTSTVKYIDSIVSSDLVMERYEVAKKRLEELNLKYLIEDLTYLAYQNTHDVSIGEIVKSVDNLILTIKNKIDANDKKSELKRTPKARIRHNDVTEIKSHIG